MKIKTQDLIGSALDWAVGEILQYDTNSLLPQLHRDSLRPSKDWKQGGPIIEREHICLDKFDNYNSIAFQRESTCPTTGRAFIMIGPTPLIAAMRCFVASKLGDEVDIPEELT
jgi:hypothetical protein